MDTFATPAVHEEMISTRAAASYLGKSTHWLRTQGKRLGVPCYRVGGRYQYLKTELDAWLMQCRYNDSYRPVRTSGYVMRSKVSL